ncbi:MAG: sensor domain-containing diguanylate cyclase [Firmicutes bacterium]|nr:sensor domain-containing diguanylate cyclase [Bacillota bacterium]
MVKHITASQRRRAVGFASVSALIVLLICLSFTFMWQSSLKQRAELHTTEKYMLFESKVERLIHIPAALLQGFEAYLRSSPGLTEDQIYLYLEYLLADKYEYVRNMGILEDATILWNHPKTANIESTGTDLAQIEDQKDMVLKVKADKTPVFHGPVELVQGDIGFSIRRPLLHSDGTYWGQTSMVLKADKILQEIDAYAKNAGLSVAIFSNNSKAPFFGSVCPAKCLTYEFDIDPAFIDWKVRVCVPDYRKDNQPLFITFTIMAIVMSAATGIFVCKYLRNNYRILNMSARDYLTGLYNRHFLQEYQCATLTTARKEHHKAALIMVDLNDFKDVNDTYGHVVGDQVLVKIAQTLKGFAKDKGTAFRLGGDEFLIIFPNIPPGHDMAMTKRRLFEYFAKEFHIPNYNMNISFSLGHAVFPDDGHDLDALLKAADKRLYGEKMEK